MTIQIALLVAAAASSAPQKVAVLDIEGITGVDGQIAQLLTETLTGEVSHAPNVQVLGPHEMTPAQHKQALECEGNSACLAAAGTTLGVDLLVHATLGRIGGSELFNLQLIDVQKAEVQKRVTKRVLGEPEKVLDAMPGAVAELLSLSLAAPVAANSDPGPVLVVNSTPAPKPLAMAAATPAPMASELPAASNEDAELSASVVDDDLPASSGSVPFAMSAAVVGMVTGGAGVITYFMDANQETHADHCVASLPTCRNLSMDMMIGGVFVVGASLLLRLALPDAQQAKLEEVASE